MTTTLAILLALAVPQDWTHWRGPGAAGAAGAGAWPESFAAPAWTAVHPCAAQGVKTRSTR